MISLSEKEFYEHHELIEELCETHNGRIVSDPSGAKPLVTITFKAEVFEDCFWADYRCALENCYQI